MNKDILYLGDTNLDQAASYLAGIMSYCNIGFDYLASDKKPERSFLDTDYKAIIISDYPADNFSAEQLSSLMVKIKNGTGLLMIGGWESFTGLDGRYNETPLKDILPVVMADSDDRVNHSGPCLVEMNCAHEIVAGLPFESDTPAIGGFNEFEVKPDGIIILSSRRFTASYNGSLFKFSAGQSSPLLVAGSFGDGRTAAFASDVAPHWVGPLVDWGDKRITAQANGASQIEVGNWYAQFFANLIQWVQKETIREVLYA